MRWVGPVDSFQKEAKDQIEQDLASIGVRIVAQPGDRDLDISLAVRPLPEHATPVMVFRGGELVDQFTVGHFSPGRSPGTGCFDVESVCAGHKIAARIVESQRVAASMQRKTSQVATERRASSGKLAVLELRNYTKELTKENVQYLTDVVRQAALKGSGADVMTRENLLVLLQSSGKDLANCEGECEVDTGRRIGADQIVSGDVQKFGTKFKVSLRLHDTREGKLLSSATGTGASVDDLEESVSKAAQQLFQPQ